MARSTIWPNISATKTLTMATSCLNCCPDSIFHAAWRTISRAAYRSIPESGQQFKQEVAIVKVFVAEMLGQIVDRAIQICGSLGYSGDLPLERFYRDARAARIYDGPSEVHRMLIARNLEKAMATEGTTKAATGGLA